MMYSFIGISLLLTSCIYGEGELLIPENFFLHKTTHYSIAVPESFTYAEPAPRADYYYFGYPDGVDNGLYVIKLFDTVQSCDEHATGASSMQSLQNTNGATVWGRVDAYDSYQPSFPTEETPFCRPPILEWGGDMETGIFRSSNDAAYALCSEKDGKRVLICISQVTDNPQLAEEIFRTFRWGD